MKQDRDQLASDCVPVSRPRLKQSLGEQRFPESERLVEIDDVVNLEGDVCCLLRQAAVRCASP
jgi:hypothetical protein